MVNSAVDEGVRATPPRQPAPCLTPPPPSANDARMRPYSHSSLSLFEQCPRAFQYKYVEEAEEAFSTIERHMGHAVHATLEKAYAEKEAGRPLDAQAVQRCYEEAWNSPELAAAKVVKRGARIEDYHDDGLAMVKSYHARSYEHDGGRSLDLEARFTIELAGPDGGVRPYAGVIDRISRGTQGTLRITDYKTGRSVRDPGQDLQLRSYALHALSQHAVDDVELCYEDLRNGLSRTMTFRRASSEAVKTEILERIGRIERAEAFPPKPSPLCAWCGFNTVCPASKYRPASGFRRSRPT
jgi:putative RecB family exonuclease